MHYFVKTITCLLGVLFVAFLCHAYPRVVLVENWTNIH